jgi:hypothetical protein
MAMWLTGGGMLEGAPTHAEGKWNFENDSLRVSVSEATGRWDVLDKRCNRWWRQAASEIEAAGSDAVKAIRPLPPPAQGVEITLGHSHPKGGTLPLTVRLSLVPDRAEVICEISGDADAAIDELAMPSPIVLDAAEGVMVVSHQAGLLFRVDELAWHAKKFSLTMPWFGAQDLASGQGYMTIVETPDDAWLYGEKVRGNGRDVLSMGMVFIAQKGKLGYSRRLLYHFLDRGGYVAMAKRYRAYAREKGLVKTLAEKRKERPAIDRLVGAVNIYGSDFQNIEELKRLGIERAVVSGFTKDRVRQISEWGYLPTRYDIYTDLYEPDTKSSKMERCAGFTFPQDVAKQADGSNERKPGKGDPRYQICWTCGLRTLREKMPKRLSESSFQAYFLDCVTNSKLGECYDPQHPLTRTTDRETRVKQFAYLSKELGLVVGSEEGRDWAAAVADYFEGVMGTGTWLAFNPKLHAIPFEPFVPTARYEDLSMNPARRVPLFQLVYGDCTETTWRWGDNNHRMLGLWAQKDLLNIIHASMPTWVLWRPQQDLFRNNLDRFKECYDHVCRWRRAVGYSEMTNHQRLTKDGLTQRSTFANGASVTVNFAREPRTLADGTTIAARSFLIRGDAPELAGLPVGRSVPVSDNWQPRLADPKR